MENSRLGTNPRVKNANRKKRARKDAGSYGQIQ